ncbi:MAG: trypsin-like peptidase domain-containing protein [Thermomicrobiales bacterium]|nr:trypsin-like peptidase domain-containing protein [Thermomicrobiales bacterium]
MQRASLGTLALFLISIDPEVSRAQSFGSGPNLSPQGFDLNQWGQVPDQGIPDTFKPEVVLPQREQFGPMAQDELMELYQRHIGNGGLALTPLPPELAENEGYSNVLKFYDGFASDVFEDDGRHRINFFKMNGSFNPELAIQNGKTSILYTDIVRLSRSVALVTATKNVTSLGGGKTTLKTKSDDLCEEVKFSGSLIAGHCTAFLAFDQQTIVTANHCIPDQGDYSVVFDFSSSPTVDSETVFHVVHTATSLQDANHDLAILRLDRPVPSEIAEPLEMNLVSGIELDTRVGIIGHPMGMGKIVEFGDESRVKDVLEAHFRTNNDAFHGNSGSPVFNQETLAVEGILQQGQYDLVKDIDRNCTVVRTVDADGADNSGVVLGFQTALMSIKAATLWDEAQ